jgi:RimJ/RimL family protein N-acetyltransferase
MQLVPVTLRGQQVRLEPLAAGHIDGLIRNAADAAVWEHIAMDPLRTPELAMAYVVATQRELAAGRALTFAVVRTDTGEAVGTTTYFDVSVADRRLEIGSTWLGRECWRTAINTESKLLLLTHAFEVLGCLRVQLKTDIRNVRSQSAIARLGATREGVLRAHMRRRDGTQRDTVMFSIIATEWPAVKTRLQGLLAR